MKLKEESRVFLPLLLSIIVIATILIIVFIYGEMPSGIAQENLVEGLTEFYRNDYYSLREYQKDQYCDIEMKVWTANNSVLVSSHCTAEYPYSVLEAFNSVARGNITAGGSTLYTNLDWAASDEEAYESTLELMQYLFVATVPGKTTNISSNYLCFVPCLDNNAPNDIDVISVEYNPDKESIYSLFQNYNLENFRGLTFYSDYEYLTFYSSADRSLKWRYLTGKSDFGSFRLLIEVDKPILNIENQREDVETLVETPVQEYEITKINANSFMVSGSGNGIDLLVVEW